MKQTIKAAREARGWTQKQLAEQAEISVHLISRVERGESGLTFPQLELVAGALQTSAHELHFPEARANGRPPRAARGLIEAFREPGRYDPSYGHPAEKTLPAARRAYPDLMCALDQHMQPEWRRFLAAAPCESSLETVHCLVELRRGAEFCQVSPLEVGFDRFPVVERDSQRIVGHCPVPALVTPDWLMILQVSVLTPRPYRLDGLVLALRPRRVFLDLEVDGQAHNPRFDEQRTRDLGLATLRLTERDVLADIPLTERLRAQGFALPKRK